MTIETQSYLWAFMLLCNKLSGSRAVCWLGGCTPTPPFTPIEFPPGKRHKIEEHGLRLGNILLLFKYICWYKKHLQGGTKGKERQHIQVPVVPFLFQAFVLESNDKKFKLIRMLNT